MTVFTVQLTMYIASYICMYMRSYFVCYHNVPMYIAQQKRIRNRFDKKMWPSCCQFSISCLITFVNTVEPRLSESPLSEPSVTQMLFLILKSQKQFDFLRNQVINEMFV